MSSYPIHRLNVSTKMRGERSILGRQKNKRKKDSRKMTVSGYKIEIYWLNQD